MLDVHHPHHPAHTWRDFFIHIATIVVGLFIALGLEQSVEVLNRHLDRKELLAALNQESVQIIHDAKASEARDAALLSSALEKVQQLKTDIVDHKPYGNPPGVTLRFAVSPDDPIYKAARAGGKLSLLSDQEIAAYGELDQLIILQRQASDRLKNSNADGSRVVELYRSNEDPGTFAAIPTVDLRRLYLELGEDASGYRAVLVSDYAAGSAASVLLKGERDLGKIQLAGQSAVPGFYSYH